MNFRSWHSVLFFALCLIAAAAVISTRRGTDTAAKQSHATLAASKVSAWNTFEDEILKFEHPPASKVNAENIPPGKMYLAFKDINEPTGNLLINYPGKKEERSLNQIFIDNQENVYMGGASKPKALKLSQNNCLIFQTHEIYVATCYNRRSTFFEVQAERNYQDRPDSDSNALIAKNFERFLRSIEFK